MLSKEASQLLLVTTTTASKSEADILCKQLVEERLAACAQCLGPITSHYVWENTLNQSEEWQCQFKTRASLFSKICLRIQELHTYSTPEIIAIPITVASKDYTTWVLENTQ